MAFEEGGGQTDQVDATSQYLDHIREIQPLSFRRIITGTGPASAAGTMANPWRGPHYVKDMGALKRPAHGVPSLRDPKRPPPRRF